jgi:transcriptional regulator with XRE-family HTH domain
MHGQQKKTEKLREFSQRLKSRMVRLDVQQNELAERLGIEPGAVSNWINARNMPKGKNLRKLAQELHCDGWWLRGGESAQPTTRPSPLPDAPGAAAPQDELRRKALEHLNLVFDECGGDLEKMTWTYVELKRRFALSGGATVSSYKVSDEHRKAIAAAEQVVDDGNA